MGALTLSVLLGTVLFTLVAFLRVEVETEDLLVPGLATDLLRSVVTACLLEPELLLDAVLSEPLTTEELLELRLVVTVELREPEEEFEPVLPL